jgi:hypothetical protein
MGEDSIVSWRLQLKFVSIGAMVGRFEWQESRGDDCHEDMYETPFSRTSCIQGVWKWRGGVDNMSNDVTEEGVL